jgi:hypothetical protein
MDRAKDSMMMMQRHRQMMLLSGISTAIIFAMMQTYWPMRMTRRHRRASASLARQSYQNVSRETVLSD